MNVQTNDEFESHENYCWKISTQINLNQCHRQTIKQTEKLNQQQWIWAQPMSSKRYNFHAHCKILDRIKITFVVFFPFRYDYLLPRYMKFKMRTDRHCIIVVVVVIDNNWKLNRVHASMMQFSIGLCQIQALLESNLVQIWSVKNAEQRIAAK